MRRRGLALIAVLALAAAPGAQDWRSVNIAAFDETWQTINDTFYDPSFGGLDWTAVRNELRPRAEAAGSPQEVRAVIREMLARLERSHFALLSPSAVDEALPGPLRVPIDVRVIERQIVVTRVSSIAASAAGLAPGQQLLQIGDRPVADLRPAGPELSARVRNVEWWRRVHRLLHAAVPGEATLRVREASGRERALRVRREPGTGEIVTLGNLPPLEVRFTADEKQSPRGRRVAVIAFSIWMAPVTERVAQAVDRYRDAAGIVIDLRGNPGGLAAMMSGVAGHFFDERVVLGTMQTRQARLVFPANPQRSTSDGRSVTPYAGPVAILVDELTASASETFAAGMQSLGRARVFGAQTMGQALPASTRRLRNGDVLMHAVGDFVTSTGKSVEGEGVIPDEQIALSREGLVSGGDPVLEAALAWIDRAPLPRPALVAMLQTPARPALPSAFSGRFRPWMNAPVARVERCVKRQWALEEARRAHSEETRARWSGPGSAPDRFRT